MRLPSKFSAAFWAGALLACFSPVWAQQITTIAGTGVAAFSGDGGAATQATFNNPVWVESDLAGNLYIADQNNNRIRRVDTKGIITTVAGSGAPGFSGDGGPAIQASLNGPTGLCFDAAGDMFIADLGNLRIRTRTRSARVRA